MPIYSYICDHCGVSDMVVKPVAEYKDPVACKECGGQMRKDLVADSPHAQSRGRMYATPIHSNSLAIAKSQVAEHKRLFPNIEIDDEFRPVFDNYPDHEAYLQATGFVKMPQKVRHVFAKKK